MRPLPRVALPLLLLALFLGLSAPGAQDLAFSVGTWSFFPDASGTLPSKGPGAFASFGATYGLGPRLEAGISLLPRLTPEPIDDIFVEEHVGISLFGDRVGAAGGPAVYINTLVDIGFIFGLHAVRSGDPEYSRAVFLRLTPITLGNPYYGRRDRIFSAGLLYDYDADSASFFFNLIASDFFLAKKADFH